MSGKLAWGDEAVCVEHTGVSSQVVVFYVVFLPPRELMDKQ